MQQTFSMGSTQRIMRTEGEVPRLLIVSEVSFGKSAMGAGRTLFNLFEEYPKERLLACAPADYLEQEAPDVPFQGRVIPCARKLVGECYRMGKLINPMIRLFNYQRLASAPMNNWRVLLDFDPNIVLVCPITPVCLIVGHRILRRLRRPGVVYFMDDWMANDGSKWVTGNVQATTRHLLKSCSGWLMISRELEAGLAARYQCKPRKSLIVHSPVEVGKIRARPKSRENPKPFRVAYAGSIWPWQYDTLKLVAEAICRLQTDGVAIELMLYTGLDFWNLYENTWRQHEVRYGGLFSYEEVRPELSLADLLLSVNSFAQEHSASKASFPTKITDYMAAGVPVVSCGPPDCAANRFIREHGCGVLCETRDVQEIESVLRHQITHRRENDDIARRALNLVRMEHSKEHVSRKLYEFIRAVELASREQN